MHNRHQLAGGDRRPLTRRQTLIRRYCTWLKAPIEPSPTVRNESTRTYGPRPEHALKCRLSHGIHQNVWGECLGLGQTERKRIYSWPQTIPGQRAEGTRRYPSRPIVRSQPLLHGTILSDQPLLPSRPPAPTIDSFNSRPRECSPVPSFSRPPTSSPGHVARGAVTSVRLQSCPTMQATTETTCSVGDVHHATTSPRASAWPVILSTPISNPNICRPGHV